MSARYPLAPLEALVGRPSSAELAERVGVSRQAVNQWRRRGLSEHQADVVACRLGWWPGLVWPEWLASCPTGEVPQLDALAVA